MKSQTSEEESRERGEKGNILRFSDLMQKNINLVFLNIVLVSSHRYEWRVTEPDIWRVQCRYLCCGCLFIQWSWLHLFMHISCLQYSERMFFEEDISANCRPKGKCNFHYRRLFLLLLFFHNNTLTIVINYWSRATTIFQNCN